MAEKIARVAYRFDASPATYDFVTWMAIVERARLEQGIDKIVIAFVPGTRDFSDRDKAISAGRHAWRSTELLPALTTLLPSCMGAVVGDPKTDQQTVPYLVNPFPFGAYLAGPAYMQDLIPFHKPYVTLTVRQSWFESDRDTTLIWNELIPQFGLPVVVVPDTEAMMDGIPCRITAGRLYPPAAMNPRLMFALYKKARLNLFTGSGCASLAYYSDVNAEVFGIHHPQYKICEATNLLRCGFVDGGTVQNTRSHWDANPDTILAAVKERLSS